MVRNLNVDHALMYLFRSSAGETEGNDSGSAMHLLLKSADSLSALISSQLAPVWFVDC